MEEKKVQQALEVARAIQITDNVSYSQAVMFFDNLKALEKEIDEAFDGSIKAAFAAHKTAVAAKKKFSDPVETAKAMVKAAIAKWEKALREKAEEEKQIAISMGAADLVPEPVQTRTHMRKVYSAEVVDKAALLRAALAGQISMDLITVDQGALNSIAIQAHELFSVPGCKLVVKEVPCAR